MKKSLSIIFALCILFINAGYLHAQGDNSDPVTFFESTENLLNLKSYKAKQGLSGGFKFSDKMSGENYSVIGNYRLTFSSDIYNNDYLEQDIHTIVNGHLNVNLEGNDIPFDNLLLNVRAELIMINGDGLYARLENVVLNAKGVPADEMDDYNEFKQQINDEISQIKGQWIYFPEDQYKNQLDEEVPSELSGILDKNEFADSLKKDGLKKTLEKYLDDIIEMMKTEGSLSDADALTFKKIADEFLKTEFFAQKDVTMGASKGFVSFRLDRGKLFGFFAKVADIAGETLSASDLNMLRAYLTKFILSGAYHIDDKYRIYDDFRVRGTIRNIGPLEHLQTTFAYQVSNINKVKPIKEPDQFTSADNAGIPFLMPSPIYDETDVDTNMDLPIE